MKEFLKLNTYKVLFVAVWPFLLFKMERYISWQAWKYELRWYIKSFFEILILITAWPFFLLKRVAIVYPSGFNCVTCGISGVPSPEINWPLLVGAVIIEILYLYLIACIFTWLLNRFFKKNESI